MNLFLQLKLDYLINMLFFRCTILLAALTFVGCPIKTMGRLLEADNGQMQQPHRLQPLEKVDYDVPSLLFIIRFFYDLKFIILTFIELRGAIGSLDAFSNARNLWTESRKAQVKSQIKSLNFIWSLENCWVQRDEDFEILRFTKQLNNEIFSTFLGLLAHLPSYLSRPA